MPADITDLVVFAGRLATAGAKLDVLGEAWQDRWSETIAGSMRAAAPRNTGALASSITVTDDGVEVGVPYGRFVEYGTSRQAPQPFMRPSVAIHRPLATVDAAKQGVAAI